MPVYQEPTRVTLEGPSLAHFRKDLNGSADIYWRTTAFKAARCLALVFHDFDRMLNEILGAGAGEVPQDAKDLLRLGMYLLKVPLQAAAEKVRADRYEAQKQSSPPQPAPRLEKIFDSNLSYIGSMLLRAQRRLTSDPSYSVAVQHDVQTFEEQINKQLPIPDVPALGSVELLARLVGRTSQNLAAFKEKMQRLELRQDFQAEREPANAARGIPRVIFACAGQDVAPVTFVITSSRDVWEGYNSMENWSFNCRKHRTTMPPIQSAAIGKSTLDIVKMSGEFKTVVTLCQSATRAKERLGVIQSFNAKIPEYAKHGREKGLPFSCPEFDEKARCLRCQALFTYDVGEAVLGLEERLRKSNSPLQTLTFDDWTCAETFAHGYCRAAHGPVGESH